MGELTVEEFRKIVLNCNATYAAAFMVQFQSGSGVGELQYINVELADHVWDEVRRAKRIIKLNLPGRKANRNVHPYYTFIGSDAIDCLKRLFQSRGWKRDSVLFRTERGDPISANSLQGYFRKHAMQLGLISAKTPACVDCGGQTVKRRVQKEGDKTFYLCVECGSEKSAESYGISKGDYSGIRYRMRTHELRDLFKTEWHRASAVFGVDLHAADFFMGHTVDALMYDKLMRDKVFALDQYQKAMPMLNILSDDPRRMSRTEVHKQLEASEAKVDALAKELGELRKKMKVLDDPKLLEILDAVEEWGKDEALYFTKKIKGARK